MHCPYCGAHYSVEKPCFCQPPVVVKSTDAADSAVKGPWGEAEAKWSEAGEPEHRAIG